MTTTTRYRGRVTRFDQDRGFGFVTALPMTSGREVFVHFRSVNPPRPLPVGTLVEYTVAERPNRPNQYHAVDVTILEASETGCGSNAIAR
ncbi:hypothetical protein BH18ACI5_BH18ACI5_04380 [soil metagenome]